MREGIEAYLKRIVRYSGLSKHEQADWMEEMYGHIDAELSNLMNNGYNEREATDITLKKFGEASTVRKQISRDTIGLTLKTVLVSAFICFVLFCIDLNVVISQSPGPWFKQYSHASGYVVNMLSAAPFSPSLMLALCVSLLFLLKTRRRIERAAIGLTLALFGLLWVLIRLPLSPDANSWIFGFRDMGTREPWIALTGAVLIVWGSLLYLWTKNTWVSILPTILSIAVGLWIQSRLLVDVFLIPHAHPRPFNAFLELLLSVAIRCVSILCLLIVFRYVDYMSAHKSVTMN